jgi:hypothetical protein
MNSFVPLFSFSTKHLTDETERKKIQDWNYQHETNTRFKIAIPTHPNKHLENAEEKPQVEPGADHKVELHLAARLEQLHQQFLLL